MSGSLRLRLALWYGALAGAPVMLVCTYSYAIHSRTLYDELDNVLRSVSAHVAEEFTSAASPSERVAVLDASRLLGAGVRVYGPDGATVGERSAGDADVPVVVPRAVLGTPQPVPYSRVAALVPGVHHVDARPGAFGVLEGPDGRRWRVYVLPLAGGTEYLAATLPLMHVDDAVARFGRLMVLMAAVSAGATFLAGWLLARGALRPIVVYAETAGAIAQARLFSRRMPTEGRRDELERLAEIFNGMLDSLEEAHEAQQRFISAASHEMRAPLTVIQANLEALQREGRLSEAEREQAVREAHAETSRLARIVGALLVLARSDAGVTIRREPVELDRVLLDVLGEARHLAQGQRLDVDQLEPKTIRGDPDRLKQLMLILVDNAIHYTPPDGRVSVAMRRDGDGVEVVVRDTGIGIAAKDLPHVFERFYRADPARSQAPGGTGLGLPIARLIAAEHGGTVELTSVEGQGTTATVRLPGAE